MLIKREREGGTRSTFEVIRLFANDSIVVAKNRSARASALVLRCGGGGGIHAVLIPLLLL